MTTPFSTKITKNILNDWSSNFSDTKFDVKLAATTDTTLTITGTAGIGAATSTTDSYVAIFKIQDAKTVFVALNETAAATSSGSFAATTSDQIKSNDARTVKQGDVLHFFTPDSNVYVTVLLYAVN